MPRAGKNLEELVAILEEQLGSTDVKVTSPDYIHGQNSGSNREVDIALRNKIGSTEILVIIECRDRQNTQGVDWIEQLAGKRDDVRAAKAIAVSSTDFSSGARSTAKRHNIELRTLTEINEKVVDDWVQVTELIVNKYILGDSKIELEFFEEPDDETTIILPSEMNNLTKVFRRVKDGILCSVSDIWNTVPRDRLYAGAEPTGVPITKRVALNFTNEEDCYEVETTSGMKKIRAFNINAEVSILQESFPISSHKSYNSEESGLASTTEINFEINGLPHTIGFHRIHESDERFITVSQKNTKKK